MIEGLKVHSKKVEKHRDFFRWPNSHGRPAQVEKILKNEKFSKAISIFGHFKSAFHLMDSARIFSYKIWKTHCPISQSLDDMYASLPVLKYRPPFLLSLLVAWLMRTCYLWFGSSLSLGFYPTRVGPCKSISRFVYTTQPLWCPSWATCLLEIFCLVK